VQWRVLLPLIGLSFLTPAGGAVAECPQRPSETVHANRVTPEGNLLLSDGRVVHLAGAVLDGPNATDALQALVTGQPLRLTRLDEPPDRWGRMLGSVEVSESGAWTSAAGILLARGLGHAAAQSERVCLAPLLAAEAGARQRRLGVWGDPDYVLSAADKPVLLGRLGDHVVAAGRVRSARLSGTRIYLNFSRRWRDGLTVILHQDELAALGIGDVSALPGLEGRFLRVRGFLDWRYGGPVILHRNGEPIERIPARERHARGNAR